MESGDIWYRWIDTALDSPHDIVPWETAPPIPGRTYRAEERSVVVLFARIEAGDSKAHGRARKRRAQPIQGQGRRFDAERPGRGPAARIADNMNS